MSDSNIILKEIDLIFLLENAQYKFAITMPDSPHWYTLRETWVDDRQFVSVVKTIRKIGHIVYYKGYPYMCFDMNGYRYWTMGSVIEKTILINKAKINENI